MFDIAEQSAFTHGPFTIVKFKEDLIEIRSHITDHMWLIKKFNEDGYPPMVLYHSHSRYIPYHVHNVFDNDNALLCYIEINNHDKMIAKKIELREKITNLTNKELIAALA